MVRELARKLLHPLRVLAGRFIIPERASLVGPHGCIHTGASFVVWNEVEGDYLEFGVYRGDSFVQAYHGVLNNRRKHPSNGSGSRPRFVAFDSFEGLPEGPGERHADYAPGAYACSEAEFKANIAKRGVDLEDVVVVRGSYERTLNAATKQKHGLKKAALVMIDCDLYESTVPVLDFLTELVDQGTVLIFHDWFRFKGSPKFGEQRACREWLARNPHLELIEYWREGPQAVSFLVNLK